MGIDGYFSTTISSFTNWPFPILAHRIFRTMVDLSQTLQAQSQLRVAKVRKHTHSNTIQLADD
jgi:hypothetical protein